LRSILKLITWPVDFDPVIIAEWKAKDREIIYGDLEDPDLLSRSLMKKAIL
jgi:hypothetical protein